jgi:hypothetical protein
MKTKTPSPFLALTAAVALAGCITQEQTVYRDEPRLKVAFENDPAARMFYETLSKMPGHDHKTESNTEVKIPIVFEHKHRVVQGESTKFNSAVRRCDTNGDGHITEAEARIFSQQF